MSRTGNPYDNAYAESFMKTLKCEEVYRNEYRSLEEAAASIGEFIERGGLRRPVPLRQLSRRSGCVPAEPYPPLSFTQSGPQ